MGRRDTILSPRDSLINYSFRSRMMSMDPKTGYVKAYVGGINYKYFQYDHVKVGRRQVGSTFVVFIFFSYPRRYFLVEVPNVPVVFASKGGVGKRLDSKELRRLFNNMSITLKFGLATSINTITAYIMKQLGSCCGRFS